MKKLAIASLALLFALSAPALSMADGMGKGMHAGKGGSCGERKTGWMRGMGLAKMFRGPWFYLKHSDELKLTDEQKTSLKKLSSELKKDMIEKGADVKVKRLELAETLASPDYKAEDATARLKALEDARMAFATDALQYSIQARNVLTPEQLKGLRDVCGRGPCDKRGCKDMKRHRRCKDYDGDDEEEL